MEVSSQQSLRDIFDNLLSSELKNVDKCVKKYNLSEEEIERCVNDVFKEDNNSFSLYRQLVSSLVSFVKLLLVSLLIYATISTHLPTQKLILRYSQSYIYPLMRQVRLWTLPVIQKYPFLSELHEEQCLLTNPFYTNSQLECWPCDDIRTLVDLSHFHNYSKAYIFNEKPFIVRDVFNETVTLKSLSKLFLENDQSLSSGTAKFTSNIDRLSLNQFFSSPDEFLKNDLKIVWKMNRVSAARIIRKLFIRPHFVPENSEVSLQRYVYFDGWQSSQYTLPRTDFANVWLAQGQGYRLIVLDPSETCQRNCSSVSVLLRPKDVLYYNWQFYTPRSLPSRLSTENLMVKTHEMKRLEKEQLLRYHQVTIFTSLFVGYACYAYNRKCVSFAMPELIEHGLSKNEAGLIASSQNLAYAISKFLGGVLSDRLSSKLLFSCGLFMSGVVTILFASSNSVVIFTGLWFLNGFAQGAGWPACAKLLRKWYSPTQFGTYWSVLSASANISGGVSPFIASFIILNYGWRISVVVAGVVSVALSAISVLTIVNCPSEIGLESFSAKEESKNEEDKSSYTTKDIFRNPFLWLVSFCYLSVFCSKTSAVDWGQLYLIEDRHRDQYVGSAFTSSVETGGFIGGILAGFLTDIAIRRKSKGKGNPRMPVALLFMVGVTVCFHLLQFYIDEHSSQLLITSLGFTLGACLYGPIAIFGVAGTESVPISLSGTAHAMVALAANIGAIISGLPFSFVAKYYNWSAVFLVLEALSAFTVILMLFTRNLSSNMIKVKTA